MKKTHFVDPRTKLFLLLTMNILLLSLEKGESISLLRFGAGFLPVLMLAVGGKYKIAVSYGVIYLGCHAVGFFWLPELTGFSAMFLGFVYSLGTRFAPGGMMGLYFLTTTRVNEFVLAMEKMHISQKIIIPLSVMFRFFPAVGEEASGISDAMRMRKLGLRSFWYRPAAFLEYRMVPLMMSVVNIGEELSASALTRCLGQEKTRTSISDGGFGPFDLLLFLGCAALILAYFTAAGGCW